MTKSTKTNHYTYIIRHINGRYYVGRRSTKKDPLLDSYMGSGTWVKSIKDRFTLTKDIIAYYPSIEELKVAEMKLIDKYFLDEYCMNVAYSSCGAASGDKNPRFGKIHTEETKKLMSAAKSGDKHPQYGKTGESHPRFGTVHTDQAKQKISDTKTGEKAYQATITDHIARLIKIRIAEWFKNKSIADEYNTTVNVVKHIRSGRSWKHITI